MEHVSVVLFWVAFLLYGAAFVLFVYHLVSKRPVFNRWGLFVVVAAWIAQTVALVLRGVSAGHVPVFGAYESLSLTAWFIALVYLILELRTNVRAIGLYAMPAVLILLGVAWANYSAPAGLLPVLKSDLVALHVAVIFTSLAAFNLAAGAAVPLPHRGLAAQTPRLQRRARAPAIARDARQAHLPRHPVRAALPLDGHHRRHHPGAEVGRARLVPRPAGARSPSLRGPCTRGSCTLVSAPAGADDARPISPSPASSACC